MADSPVTTDAVATATTVVYGLSYFFYSVVMVLTFETASAANLSTGICSGKHRLAAEKISSTVMAEDTFLF